nr:MAG TPA: hypothetical protein [Caudoviricetes sp.]
MRITPRIHFKIKNSPGCSNSRGKIEYNYT